MLPIWIDINSDGMDEIVLTMSNVVSGASLHVYSEKGQLIAYSIPIGKKYRWIHLLAVASFGPQKEIEITAVRAPHSGGRVEYYRKIKNKLNIYSSLIGFPKPNKPSDSFISCCYKEIENHYYWKYRKTKSFSI